MKICETISLNHRAPRSDVEAGVTHVMSSKAETHNAIRSTISEPMSSQKPTKSVLDKMPFFKHHDQSKKFARKPIPDDIDLTTLTRILRNMVAANDLEGVTTVLDTMQADKKSDGFTIQNVAGDGLLQMAALRDFDAMTKLLLEKGFDINYIDDNHGTALQAAIYMDSGKVIKVLCATESIKVNTVGGYYGCALQVAAFKGSSDYIDKLEKLGVKKDVYISKSKYGTALQAAARTGSTTILERILLLDATQINKKGGAWGTALQAAAKGDYTEATAKLRQLSRGRVLEQSSDKDRKKGGKAPEYLKVAEILLGKHAEVNVETCGRLQNPINAAASSGQYEMLKLLLDKDTAPNDDERNLKYGRALLSAITQTSTGEKLGESQKPDKVEKTDKINKNRLRLVKELVGREANVGFMAGNCLHNSPLAAAAAMNDVKVVEFLLENKEEDQKFIDTVSGIHGSALRAALSATPPAKDTAKFLITKGADVIAEDDKFGNVLHLAAFANLPDIVTMLLDSGKHDVDVLDKNYQTALHIAAYRGYEKVVEILLVKNADANLKDVWGDIPLDIVGGVIARESHPVPSLQGLRQIREILLKNSEAKTEQQVSGPFPGPGVQKQITSSQTEPTAKPVYDLPSWNPGLKFYAKIVDFLENGQQEYVLVKDLAIDDLLYKADAMEDTMKTSDKTYERKLRWIHLPTNNMTWAEILMKILWPGQYQNTACKSIWGTDPYFVSPDLAPHARFVTPQCGRLIQETTSPTHLPERTSCKGTLFFAMPYIHWESFKSQEQVGEILHRIIKEISKTKIWRSNEKVGLTNDNPSRQNSEDVNEPTPSPGGDDGVPGAKNVKNADYDEGLLKTYLYKRWPVHMRRTLDQYYYSYLADTKTRDGDQVAMRTRERKLREEAEFSAQYVAPKNEVDTEKNKKIEEEVREKEKKDRKNETKTENKKDDPEPKLKVKGNKASQQTKVPKVKHDDNSPVVMIDQLWVWVVSKNLVVTSFPKRRSVKLDGDLDPANKTDVLKTLLDYLHSTKRAPVNNAYDLCELVVSQTVGILHRSDMIPELDFLKIFATQADWAIDQVMRGLTKFVVEYTDFVKWLNGKDKDLKQYARRFEEIFSVTNETELLREIQDMKDELNMLSAVFNDQKSVLKKVGENIEASRAALLAESTKTTKKDLAGSKETTGNEPAESNEDTPRGESEDRTKVQLVETSLSAFSFQQQSDKHARHIKRMQDQANQAYSNLQDLLSFKQQQANVLEARVNRNQSITAKEQNKTIMVFTIVTIIFLPLTFMTTVFTLPILEFPRYDATTLEPSGTGNLKIKYVFSIVVGATVIMAVPLIIAAFKIRRLQSFWKKMKRFRLRIFPLHLAGKKGIPDPGPSKEEGIPLIWRFYWKGPSPHRHEELDDI